MKRILFIISSLFLFVLSSCNAQNHSKAISNEQARVILQDSSVQVVDVRTASEVSEGKLKDAIVMDYFSPDFKEQLKKLDPKKPVLVYCKSGGRSKKACEIMRKNGFETVYDLKGGYLNWVK